ncbi:MAG: site-2 protease family protein [SAR324 cluster bacterium]|nr:site-2 protease family protein [SAR324 cluster bacterium]
MHGRMSINPFVHLDIFGSLMLLFVGIGYAKPVPVDPRNFRYKNADLYVSAAGPGMNLLLALIGGIFLHLLSSAGGLSQTAFQLLYLFMLINMSLCLFNLIPLGPLDGSYVLPHFLPVDIRRKYQMWNMQYGTHAIMGMLLLSIFLPSWSPFSWISRLSQGFIGMIISV